MHRVITTFLVLIINFVLQSTLFQLLKIRGVIPNTAIIIIVSMSLLRGSREGAVVGFCSGLLQDIFFGYIPGYYAVLGLACGYLVGKFNKGFYRENYILPILLTCLSTLAYESVVYVTGPLFSGNTNYIFFLFNLIFPEAVYNAVFTIIIYRILFALNSMVEQKERHKRKLFSIK